LDGPAQDVKIVFFNRFFFPDTSATSQIVSDLAFHLAGAGHHVHAVTSRVSGGLARHETIRGVVIHRIAGSAAGTPSLFRRGLAYVAFYRGARRAATQLIREGDIVVVKTDPPLLSCAIGPLAKERGAKVVVWLQDVFPEVAHVYGVPAMGGPSGAFLRLIRDQSLAIADHVVVIGDRMADFITRSRRIERERVSVIHNWADGGAIAPIHADENPLRARWDLDGKFVVGYSGNLGRVHEFDTMLEAASRLRSEPQIQFLVIGRGPRFSEVKVRVEREGLTNVRFKPHQARSALAESLGVADVHVSVLRPEFEGLVHPSKLYGIMAAGRPTLFVGDVNGETASIISRTKSGVAVPTGDVDGLVGAILELRKDPSARLRMGRQARLAFDESFAMTTAMRKWESLMGSLVSS
jgi:glycosyltransferase involved in cell wall biosynthesis